jgi:hypothetical protein
MEMKKNEKTKKVMYWVKIGTIWVSTHSKMKHHSSILNRCEFGCLFRQHNDINAINRNLWHKNRDMKSTQQDEEI